MPRSCRGAVRQGSQCRDHRCQLADGREVEIDGGDLLGARDVQTVPVERDLRAEGFGDVPEPVAGLRGVRGPVSDGHGPARGDRGRGEGGGVRQIRFDLDVEPARLPGFDDPAFGLGFADVDSGVSEDLDRHVDMGAAGHGRAGVDEFETQGHDRTGQQQTRDELAGGAGIDVELAAAHLRRGMHGHRQHALGRGDLRAEAAQRIHGDRHRAHPCLFVPVEDDLTTGQRRHRGDEAHDEVPARPQSMAIGRASSVPGALPGPVPTSVPARAMGSMSSTSPSSSMTAPRRRELLRS